MSSQEVPCSPMTLDLFSRASPLLSSSFPSSSSFGDFVPCSSSSSLLSPPFLSLGPKSTSSLFNNTASPSPSASASLHLSLFWDTGGPPFTPPSSPGRSSTLSGTWHRGWPNPDSSPLVSAEQAVLDYYIRRRGPIGRRDPEQHVDVSSPDDDNNDDDDDLFDTEAPSVSDDDENNSAAGSVGHSAGDSSVGGNAEAVRKALAHLKEEELLVLVRAASHSSSPTTVLASLLAGLAARPSSSASSSSSCSHNNEPTQHPQSKQTEWGEGDSAGHHHQPFLLRQEEESVRHIEALEETHLYSDLLGSISLHEEEEFISEHQSHQSEKIPNQSEGNDIRRQELATSSGEPTEATPVLGVVVRRSPAALRLNESSLNAAEGEQSLDLFSTTTNQHAHQFPQQRHPLQPSSGNTRDIVGTNATTDPTLAYTASDALAGSSHMSSISSAQVSPSTTTLHPAPSTSGQLPAFPSRQQLLTNHPSSMVLHSKEDSGHLGGTNAERLIPRQGSGLGMTGGGNKHDATLQMADQHSQSSQPRAVHQPLPSGSPSPMRSFMSQQQMPTAGPQMSAPLAQSDEGQPGPSIYRLSVKVPSFGVFYVFVDPRCKVAQLVTMVEQQVADLYRSRITVFKLQDEFNVDLPPSYTVGSMLRNNTTVIADYLRKDNANTQQSYGTNHAAPHPSAISGSSTSSPSPLGTLYHFSSSVSPSSSDHTVRQDSRLGWVSTNVPNATLTTSPQPPRPNYPPSSSSSTPHLEGGPRQNSATYSSSTLKMPISAPAAIGGPSSPPTATQSVMSTISSGDMVFIEQPPAKVFQNKEFSCTVSVANELLESLRGLEDERTKSMRVSSKDPGGESPQGTEGELPIEIEIVEQNGPALSNRDYSLRRLLMDKRKGMIIFFIKIRKNSYYGRRPFILMLRGRGSFAGLAPVYSEPIVVSAKKKKKRSKKAKQDHQNPAGPTPADGVADTSAMAREKSSSFHTRQQLNLDQAAQQQSGCSVPITEQPNNLLP